MYRMHKMLRRSDLDLNLVILFLLVAGGLMIAHFLIEKKVRSKVYDDVSSIARSIIGILMFVLVAVMFTGFAYVVDRGNFLSFSFVAFLVSIFVSIWAGLILTSGLVLKFNNHKNKETTFFNKIRKGGLFVGLLVTATGVLLLLKTEIRYHDFSPVAIIYILVFIATVVIYLNTKNLKVIMVKSFISYCFQPFLKYAQFRGRARRTEYWGFYLLTTLVSSPIVYWLLYNLSRYTRYSRYHSSSFPSEAVSPLVVLSILYLVVSIPTMAVFTRRMHDVGKSGWTWLYVLIPLVGPLVILSLLFRKGDVGANIYGEDPKSEAVADRIAKKNTVKESQKKSEISGGRITKKTSVNIEHENKKTDLLRKYSELLKDGILTKEEFEAKKKELL